MQDAARCDSHLLEESADYEETIRGSLAKLDFESIAKEFHEQDQFIFFPRFLPASLTTQMVSEFRSFDQKDVHRVYLIGFRKAGTIAQRAIAKKAPLLYALYRSPSLLEFTSRLAGVKLAFKNDKDAHAAALYVYQRPGDHVSFHYDDCGCESDASYTGTFGLINRTTSSKVHFQLLRNHPTRSMKELYLSMEPGSFVFFCGCRAYHRVTPLGRDEERVTYSFAHVREGKKLVGLARFRENIKDAILYFGPKALFQDNYR